MQCHVTRRDFEFEAPFKYYTARMDIAGALTFLVLAVSHRCSEHLLYGEKNNKLTVTLLELRSVVLYNDAAWSTRENIAT